MSYVYTFASSLDGNVFYVGKGCDSRVKSHLWEASGKKQKVSRVAHMIRSIWQQGGKVIIRKPLNNVDDSEAIQREKELIAFYGYEQLVNQEWYASHQNRKGPPQRANG